MASDEQMKQAVDRTNAALKELGATIPGDLAREGDLGKDLSFQPAVSYIRRTIDLFKPLQGYDLSQVGFSSLNVLQNQAENAANTLRQIKSFSPSRSNNPNGERQQIINQVRDNYDSYFASVAPIVAFLSSGNQTLESARIQQEEQLKALARLRAEAEESLKGVREILKASREASASVGISQQSVCFKDQADLHGRSARNWLTTGGVASVVTATWG